MDNALLTRVQEVAEQGEVFVLIPDAPDYVISNFGNIISFQRKKPLLMKPEITNHNYHRIKLYTEQGCKRCYVQDIVADMFCEPCEPCEGDPVEVHHRDHNRENNRADNLDKMLRSAHRKLHREERAAANEKEKDNYEKY